MAELKARDTWTGRDGVIGHDLPDDVDEAMELLKRRCGAPKKTQYNSKLIARAWEWLLREFGDEVDHENLTVRFMVELYLDS